MGFHYNNRVVGLTMNKYLDLQYRRIYLAQIWTLKFA